MDSGPDAWRKRVDAPPALTLRTLSVDLQARIRAYWRAQRASTEWMAGRSPAALRTIEEYQRRRQRQRPARAALTLKSYLLQEAEAVARLAKREWCATNGAT
eukprot:2556154-Prymnesium_polylepis.1